MSTDAFRKYKSLFSTTSNSFSTGSDVEITLNSVTGLPTDTDITLTFDRVDQNGIATPGNKMERIIGTVSGSTFTIKERGADGTTEQSHTSPVVEMIWNARDLNDMVDGILAEHNTDGTHSSGITLTSPLYQGLINGWVSANETWTYASATTITVPAGAAAKYRKGDKIKLTQTTVKYFYIIGVADTTLTITGGTSYTLVSEAITANYYSHASSPIGFPNVMSYTVTHTGFSTNPEYNAYFTISGNICQLTYLSTTTGVSNAAEFTITLPVTANPSGGYFFVRARDNNTALLGMAIIGSTTITFYTSAAGAGWTTSGNKEAWVTVSYPI